MLLWHAGSPADGASAPRPQGAGRGHQPAHLQVSGQGLGRGVAFLS